MGTPRSHIERERRFLVRSLPPGLEQCRNTELSSAYFSLSRKEYFRVRRDGGEHVLDYKKGTGVSRREIEGIPISEHIFGEFWKNSDPRWRSEKTRYYVPHRGKTIEVNVYHRALRGFVMAEVTVKNSRERLRLPDWVGPEITNNQILTLNLGRDPKQVLNEARRLLRAA
jgi:adenylate cyclase